MPKKQFSKQKPIHHFALNGKRFPDICAPQLYGFQKGDSLKSNSE
jgi:hypothetical protein